MRVELPYFYIGPAYGGWQEWFPKYMMRIGGCAAVTACDSSIYFELYKGMKNLYPYNVRSVSREDYIKFSDIMEPYLRPRWTGIDTLDIYIDGFGKFLRDCKETQLKLLSWAGENNIANTEITIRNQIDNGWLIPCLVLEHKNPLLKDYVWHWFLITGYDDDNDFKVKVVSYGHWVWFNLYDLWNTGFERKGGLVLFSR